MKKIYLAAFVVISALALNSCSKDDDSNAGGGQQEEKLASDVAGNANAVLEEYTGVRCTFCPDGHRRAQALADANPGRVVLINVHTGGYASPANGWPDFTTIYGDALAGMSGLAGYPAGSMNRFTFDGNAGVAPYYKQKNTSMAISRGGFNAAGQDRMAQPTNVNLGMKTSYNAGNRTLTVTAECYYTGEETVPNYLNVAILENGVVGKQIDAGVTKTDYVHNHMLRTFLTGQWGEKVPATTKGTRWKQTYTYEVPAEFNPSNLEVAVYVSQENGGKKQPIINGIVQKVN